MAASGHLENQTTENSKMKWLKFLLVASFAALIVSGNARAATLEDVFFAIGGQTPNPSAPSIKLYITNSDPGNTSNNVYRIPANRGGEFLVKFKDPTDPNATWVTVDASVASSDLQYNGSGWVYKTFCVEESETFNPGQEYYATIDDKIYFNGSQSSNPLGKDVADNVKIAYGLYAEGKLEKEIGPLLFQYDDNALAGALQEYIWNTQANPVHVSDLNTAITNWAAANAEQADLYLEHVKVLNLWGTKPVVVTTTDQNGNTIFLKYKNGSPAQSQLILGPIPPRAGDPLPEPMTLAMWSGLSMLGLGIARRQRRKVSA